MKPKCQRCNKEATVFITEIEGGKKVEKHLCAQCASAEGVTVKTQMPIAQLLEEFVLQSAANKELSDLRCDICGLTFAEFRHNGLMGCPNDYEAFSKYLIPLVERAHAGGSFHAGKVPRGVEENQRVAGELLRLRGQLKEAVAHEEYERAVQLRDRIKQLEGS
jgi:protein arginine kinase activator